MSISEKTVKPQLGGRQRMLGWDLWRFWGCFVIFMGHNWMEFERHLLDGMEPLSYLSEFIYPRSTHMLIFTAVPLFVIISGFFALGRPVGPNDWGKAKKDFKKYILYYWKWLAFALVIYLVFPNLWDGGSPFAGKTVSQSVVMVLGNFINTNLLYGGLTRPVSLNWFIIVVAWLLLLAPLFRSFIQNRDIKAIRTIVTILLIMGVVFPGIRLVSGDILSRNPDSAIADFFTTLDPFQAQNFQYLGFFMICFLIGGWFAVDTKAQDFVKRISWPVVGVIGVVALFLQGIIAHYSEYMVVPGWESLMSYSYGGWIPATVFYLILAYKLNFAIKEDSRIGKFTQNFSKDTLGVMITGWAFGPYMLSAVFGPVIDTMIATFWNPSTPIVLTLVWLLFNVLYYVVLMVAVHFMKKIPIVGRIFLFPGDKKMAKRA